MTSISCLVRGAMLYILSSVEVVEELYSPVRLTFDPELVTTYDDIGLLIQPSQSHTSADHTDYSRLDAAMPPFSLHICWFMAFYFTSKP